MYFIDKPIYLQYGCGFEISPKEWVNFDASPTLWLQRIPLLGYFMKRILKPLFPDNIQYGDIVKGLPIKNNVCIAIYCSHVLEHLSFDDFIIALRNTFNLLVPGGIFRLVMPDLNYLVQQYSMTKNPDASIIFMQESLLGVTKRERSISKFLRNYFGNSNHLWLWDYKAAKSELKKAGFKEIRNAQFGDSSDPKFNEIEDESRWKTCLGIECRKQRDPFE
jgi:predicted SAM-dependent methyltransferase